MKKYKKLIVFTPTPVYRHRGKAEYYGRKPMVWGFICLMVVLVLPQMILAATPALDTLDNIASKKGPYIQADSNTLSSIIGTVISLVLGLLGIIFLILMIYAGYNWMTAQGEEEKVTQAKSTITRAITGIIVVIGAYAIWNFVFSKLF